jgi:N-glycosylase/DNA lyase
VVPVDTHVHQIAMKYYGMRAPTKGKTNMTPKLYDEVNSRLVGVWGDYAGWAHSVSLRCPKLARHLSFMHDQVLFTADLKSFSTYGLPTASSTDDLIQTPSETPPASPKKRKHPQLVGDTDAVPGNNAVLEATATLADRVKRRRSAITAAARCKD